MRYIQCASSAARLSLLKPMQTFHDCICWCTDNSRERIFTVFRPIHHSFTVAGPNVWVTSTALDYTKLISILNLHGWSGWVTCGNINMNPENKLLPANEMENGNSHCDWWWWGDRVPPTNVSASLALSIATGAETRRCCWVMRTRGVGGASKVRGGWLIFSNPR